HCGLPAVPGEAFCCFGCELAFEIRAEANDDHGRLFGTLNFALVLAMLIMMLSLFLYAEDVFGASDDRDLAWLREAYRVASLILATPVMLLAGLPLAKGAWRKLKLRRISMEALIGFGALIAFLLSAWAVFTKKSGVYFDSAATAVVLATLGRYL